MESDWEFNRGDVLAKVGDIEKYVVLLCASQFPNTKSYGLARVFKHPQSVPSLHAWYEKEAAEERFVRVGRFDFKLVMEVGDAEED